MPEGQRVDVKRFASDGTGRVTLLQELEVKRSFATPLACHAEDLSRESAWLSRVLLKIADCALRERHVEGRLAKSRIEHNVIEAAGSMT